MFRMPFYEDLKMNKLLLALGLASAVAFVGCAKKEEAAETATEQHAEDAAAHAGAAVEAAGDATVPE